MSKEDAIKLAVWAFNEGYQSAFKVMDSVRDQKLNEEEMMKQFEEIIKAQSKENL